MFLNQFLNPIFQCSEDSLDFRRHHGRQCSNPGDQLWALKFGGTLQSSCHDLALPQSLSEGFLVHSLVKFPSSTMEKYEVLATIQASPEITSRSLGTPVSRCGWAGEGFGPLKVSVCRLHGPILRLVDWTSAPPFASNDSQSANQPAKQSDCSNYISCYQPLTIE